jgi:hypothetical protein
MNFHFSDHVALLTALLERHNEIVENIEGRLLNVQGKDTSRNRNREYFERTFDSCFADLPEAPRDFLRLKDQLTALHLADGFEPATFGASADVLDPLELITRAYDHWENLRWPGRNGRVAYARGLYAVFILRQLEHLSLRIWDEGTAEDRLREIQLLLDRLNEATGPNVLVRDARWLIQTAQGPLTRNIEPYFRVAGLIAGSFSESQRIEIHRAGAILAGGHLRSQLRYRAREHSRSIDDPDVLAITRNSNSMDAALLVRDLVSLLDAYERACLAGAPEDRLGLADAILQGISADPELFLARLDLLTPCTMIEDLLVDCRGDGPARYTPMGEVHLELVARYGEMIRCLAKPLLDDAVTLEPSRSAYSPLGLSYGFCADILSSMTLDGLLPHRPSGFSLEDAFVSRSPLESQRARADGWARLPTGDGIRWPVEYSAAWADQMFQRMMSALQARVHTADANASAFPTARLFVVPDGRAVESLPEGRLPDGIASAQEHLVTSDVERALSSGATAFPKSQILSDRREGRFLASHESNGKWFGVSKVVLTLSTSQGKDALMTGVPHAVLDVLRLTCPEFLVVR